MVAGELAELRGRLRAALDRLPESQRQVVVMKDVYGWSHAEIAEMTPSSWLRSSGG